MTTLQEWIHRVEVGAGARYVRVGMVLLGFWVLALLYSTFEYRHLTAPEGMDAAQVARNLSRGEGYTTRFIRPLSVALVERHEMGRGRLTNDFARLRGQPHPDLANPPLYPLLLAGAMKLLPFDHEVPEGRPVVRHQPDLLLALVNQALFFVLVLVVFRLARAWFDESVAWVSALLLGSSELIWRFTMSGLPTLLVMIEFVLLLGCLTILERESREGAKRPGRLLALAALAGVLVGVGCLTRYSFGWLLVPVLVFLLLFCPSRRAVFPAVALLAFAIVMAPWLARNHSASGTLFGTAGYSVFHDNRDLEGDKVERSLRVVPIETLQAEAPRKLLINLSEILRNDLPRLGGNWITAFFLVGLMLPFADPGRGRMRTFVVFCLVVLVPVQALGRTPGTETSPDVHSGNLLVWLAPAVFIFGSALFFTLLDRLTLPIFRGRELVSALFVLLLAAPLVLALLPPREIGNRAASPAHVQLLCDWMEPEELMMSDVPWAVAWYGDRQCIWLTWRYQDERGQESFYAVNDLRKSVRALYLTRWTLDQPFFEAYYVGSPGQESGSWGAFVLDGLVRGKPLPGFPLRRSLAGVLKQGHFFLTDRERWRERVE
jgi:hypothetical protein